jgi:uncharacterized integral membrane protein
MRLIKSLIALCFVVLGVVFGALNRQPVRVDLWFDAIDGRLGLILLSVLLLGAFIGGLVVTAGVVWPLRRRIHRSGSADSGPDTQELGSERDTDK